MAAVMARTLEGPPECWLAPTVEGGRHAIPGGCGRGAAHQQRRKDKP